MSEEVDLKVLLLAKGVEVATSTDPAIWLATMARITGHSTSEPITDVVQGSSPSITRGAVPISNVGRLAQDLGISVEELEGAIGPSDVAPYVHLDHKYWEALRSATGSRGRGAVAPAALAATLLLLWNRYAKFGDVTVALCAKVLATIDLRDKNPTRALKGCEWIQLRGNVLKLNPSLVSQAEKLARAYCTRTKPTTELA